MRLKDLPVNNIMFKQVLALASPHRARITIGLSLVLIGSLSSLAFPMAIRVVLDSALNKENAGELQIFAGGLLLILAARAFFSSLGEYIVGSAGQILVLDLRKKLFAHLQTLDINFFHAHRTGDLISRLGVDTTEIKNVVSGALGGLLNQLLMLLGSMAIMVAMDWHLAMIVLLLAPMASLVSHKFGFAIQSLAGQVQDEAASSLAKAQESLSGIALVKTVQRTDHEVASYAKTVSVLLTTTLASLRMQLWFQTTIVLLASITTVAIFWYGGLQVLHHIMTPGQLVAFLFYSQNVTQAFSVVAQQYGSLIRAKGASMRIFELLTVAPSITNKANAITPIGCRGAIAFLNVDFAYSENSMVLRNLNMRIHPGEIVAIVGRSGAGKSSAIRLLMRLYDVTSGSILVDGHDVRDLSLDWLRSQISVVEQDVFLFGMTIRENIRYGRLDATDAEVEEAARAAAADEFINGFASGYDTHVGERGVKISGGQKQRIALARVFLRRSKIIVLDEATSGVDGSTEKMIRNTLYKWSRNRGITVIIIAHRLSTVRIAHKILVMENGQLIEQGAVASLFEEGSKFRELMEDGVFRETG